MTIAIIPVATIAIMKMATALSTAVESNPIGIAAAASTHKYLFIAYIAALAVTVILSVLVWTSSNKYQDAVKQDAEARIEEANRGASEANAEAARANEGLARSNEEIARLTVKAEQARKDLAEANKQIAIAQANAEQARAQAANALTEQEKLRQENLQLSIKLEEERTARLKIEERLAPRNLTPKQQRIVADKLRPFAGQKLNLIASTDTLEVVNIAKEILSILKEAGWTFGTYIGNDLARSVAGILIEVDPDADISTKAAVQALASALSAENLVVVGPAPIDSRALTGTFTGKSIPDARIRLTVGKK